MGGNRALDTPWLPALTMLILAAAFVIARVEVAAGGDVSELIVVGARFAHPGQLLPGIHWFPNSGYDGQFFYRMATDPGAIRGGYVHGITLDTPYRLQRIGYPVLAWLASLGHPGWVPWSLVAVNVAALGALGLAGGLFARDGGRHCGWGLLLSGYWGYLFSISRDLAEAPAAALLLFGLWALRRSRPVAAALLLSASVLTRETGMVVVGAVALVRLAELWRGRARRGGPRLVWRRQAPWVVPTLAFGTWQIAIRLLAGVGAATADASANLGWPLVAAVRALHHDLATVGQRQSQLSLGLTVVLAGMTLAAAWQWRQARARSWEKLGWLLLVVLVLSLSGAVWSGQADLRSMDELFLLDAVLLLSAPRRLSWVPAAAVGLAWLGVAIHQIGAI